MLSSINPLGERTRGQRFRVTVSWYVLGSIIGGACVGLIAGTLGSFTPEGSWRFVAVATVVAVGVAMDALGHPPPSIHRQVDENWLTRYRGWVYGLGFGLQLGFGVVTIVTTASVYTTIALAGLSGSPLWGATIGAMFGMGRALPIARVLGVEDPGRLRAVMRSLQPGRVAATRMVVAAQAVVGLMAIGWILI